MSILTRNFNQDDLEDPKQAADRVKRMAIELGADAVGIGNIERWDGAPTQMDPKQIMPECKSIIAMVFRVNRGSMRGIEEGTFFSNYSSMGYGGITYIYMPMTVINLSKFIEDRGYEALPMGHQSDWRGIDNDGYLKNRFSRPVAPGKAAPDIMVHLRIAGFLCGLGEIGMSKMLITPQFGPRHRVGIVMTDLELEPDPIYDGPELCNRCGACAKHCPAQAFDKNRTVKVNLAGHDVEWWDIDCQRCDEHFSGGISVDHEVPEQDRYMAPHHGKHFIRGSHTPFYTKPRHLYNTGQAVCGARGCTRACMISLEQRGVLENTFKEKFRRRKPWSVNWDEQPTYPDDALSPEDPQAGNESETD